MCLLKIVPMAENHIQKLTEIDRVCFEQPWTFDGLKAELFSETACYFVAEKDGQAVGCAGMQSVCGECYIDKVSVHPYFRRRGIAQALVQHLIQSALKTDSEFITLEVRKFNEPAISLYKKLGFEPVGLRKNFYTNPLEDAILMTRYFKNKSL
jgi:ribosomal-protein-alanine N-acetyltransferase